MLKFTPILLAVAYGVVMYLFSAWRLKHELDARSTRLADPRIQNLTRKMAEVLDLDEIPVHIYEIEPVNGLAAPDGRIFVTRGFMEKYARGEVTAEELSSVIAHELGHVALGHARRRMVDFSVQNAVRVGLGMVLSRILPGLGAMMANFAASLLSARLSREDEYEADAWAAALLVKSGIGTGPQKSLFAKLDKLAGGAGPMPAWLLSHPRTKERIAAIEALESKWHLARV